MLALDQMVVFRLIGLIALLASVAACGGGSMPPGSGGGGNGGNGGSGGNDGFFSDDFDGPELDPAWTVLTGSFSVSEGNLVEAGGAVFSDSQLLWDGGLTNTPNQFAKLQLVDLGVRSWGFMLRFGDGSGYHYEVHLPAGGSEWLWELYDPGFVERIDSCTGDEAPTPGDWLGVTIEGAGANTKVSVWRWDADPDPGAPDPVNNWGPADCQMEVEPSVDAAGRGMGIRSFTGDSTSPSSVDNWSGGSFVGAECGNSMVEPGEECDEGGQTATCNANCTLPMCRDGVLNPEAGEECEVDADCETGERCLDCSCVVSNGRLFSDDFDGPVLDPAWMELSGSFSVSGGALVEAGGSVFTDAQLLWDGGLTDTADQLAKLQLVDLGVRSWGFMMRFGDSSGHHYEVHLPAGSSEWFWELYDPDIVERVSFCVGDQPPAPGDWLGAAVEGAGANTKVSVWRWDDDPDSGEPDPLANWGLPDCQMKLAPSVDVDGRGIGIRSFTGSATDSSSIDNWTGGDLLESIPDIPDPGSIALILDRTGAGTPGSMVDPDGIAVDSAGNVYVAACGRSTLSTGFFKITPDGDVTQLIDSMGDGVNPFACGVGVDVDSSDNAYVVAFSSDNVFKVTPTGVVTQILDSSGAGTPDSMSGPIGVAISETGDVYVSAFFSDNVHKITPEGDVSLVLDSTGDGMGNSFSGPFEIAADPFGNVFVAANGSDNVFKISSVGVVSEVIDASGDGTNLLSGPHGVGCDGAGNAYVSGNVSDNVFRVEPDGTITQIMDITGDGAGNLLDNPTGLKASADGKVYVTAFESDNAFEWDSGTAKQIISIFGDGVEPFDNPADDSVAIGPNGAVYVTGTESDTVFRVVP